MPDIFRIWLENKSEPFEAVEEYSGDDEASLSALLNRIDNQHSLNYMMYMSGQRLIKQIVTMGYGYICLWNETPRFRIYIKRFHSPPNNIG